MLGLLFVFVACTVRMFDLLIRLDHVRGSVAADASGIICQRFFLAGAFSPNFAAYRLRMH